MELLAGQPNGQRRMENEQMLRNQQQNLLAELNKRAQELMTLKSVSAPGPGLGAENSCDMSAVLPSGGYMCCRFCGNRDWWDSPCSCTGSEDGMRVGGVRREDGDDGRMIIPNPLKNNTEATVKTNQKTGLTLSVDLPFFCLHYDRRWFSFCSECSNGTARWLGICTS